MTKPTQPTFTLEQLNSVVAQAVAEALASKAEKGKADSSGEYEKLAVRAFKKAGFGDVPRSDRKTYSGWVAEGFRVRPGEHAVKVRSLRLFHRSQCVALNSVEHKAALAQLEAKKAKSSDRLPLVSPVTPITAAPTKGKKALPTSSPQPSA